MHTPAKKTPSALALLFKQRREELGLSQQQLADAVSAANTNGPALTQQSYAAFENGRSQSSKHAIGIAQTLGIPLSQVVALAAPGTTSPDEPRRRPESNAAMAGAISIWDDETPLDDDEVEVPFLKEVELAAGCGRTAIQESTTFKLRFGRRSLRRQGVQPSNAVCVTIKGNSMEPVLRSGATVGVDRGNREVVDGDLYAINHDGQLRVKQVYRLPGGGIRLRSFNRDEHPDEEYTFAAMRDNGIDIIGRVFWGAMFF